MSQEPDTAYSTGIQDLLARRFFHKVGPRFIEVRHWHEGHGGAEHQPRKEPEEGRAVKAKLATDLGVAAQCDLTGIG